ncbi:MAG: hypothetical protein HYV27_20410 [Candidatus Hydrogenedentes bacterium]|nr:hypothetical protein [Candidatus Hydrogenedentota bacterium]
MLFSPALYAVDANPPSLHSERGAWPITRQWTLEETRHFAEWVHHIYEKKSGGSREERVAKLERILTDPQMNLLLDPGFAGDGCNDQLDIGIICAMHRVVDCAKLTVAFSTYYSYRRGLPWVIGRVRACDGGDVRTAACAIATGEINSFEYDSAERFFRDAVTDTCTGNFRVELTGAGPGLSDTLPVALSREYLIPGCMYYVDGHVSILAEVTPYGAPRFLDATVAASRDVYAHNGFNAVNGMTPKRSGARGQEYAGCFRGFRVYRWPVAEVNEGGVVSRVRRRSDEEMRAFGYSSEQYDRIEELIATQRIMENAVPIDSYHQFLRLRLRSNDRVDPAAELRQFADEMVASCEEREQRVQEGWREVNENGPVGFPEDSDQGNVFTAGGRWGEYASALADTAWRAKYFELADEIDNAIAWFDRNAEEVNAEALQMHGIWSHADLAYAVLRAKERIFGGAAFEYKNSAGASVRLTLLEVEKRMYDLSFDPNHPPELRWGAPPGSLEAQTCPSRSTLLPGGGAMAMEEAYRREAYYRSRMHWEPDPSYLREMFTEGYPVLDKLDQRLRQRWFDGSSPPLVPRTGKAAWQKELAQRRSPGAAE